MEESLTIPKHKVASIYDAVHSSHLFCHILLRSNQLCCLGAGEPSRGSQAGQQSQQSLMSFRELLDAALLDDAALEGMLPPEEPDEPEEHAEPVCPAKLTYTTQVRTAISSHARLHKSGIDCLTMSARQGRLQIERSSLMWTVHVAC